MCSESLWFLWSCGRGPLEQGGMRRGLLSTGNAVSCSLVIWVDSLRKNSLTCIHLDLMPFSICRQIFQKAKKKNHLPQFVHLLSKRKLDIASQKQQSLHSPSPILICSRYPGMELILHLVYEKDSSKSITGEHG